MLRVTYLAAVVLVYRSFTDSAELLPIPVASAGQRVLDRARSVLALVVVGVVANGSIRHPARLMPFTGSIGQEELSSVVAHNSTLLN